MENIPFQPDLRPALPNVYGTFDYHSFRETLIKMDDILSGSDFEHDLINKVLGQLDVEEDNPPHVLFTHQATQARYKKLKYALRCNIARHLTGESYRSFSLRLADSTLFQWFTGISDLSSRKALSKSALERYEKYFDEGLVGDSIQSWLASLSEEKKAKEAGLTQAINYEETYMDSTCIKASIHFPTDWILLRDAARSLLSAIKTIRSQELKHRMKSPENLLKEMNNLCIKMTHTRRQKGSKKARKKVLREMKKLSRCIEAHAKRYRELLSKNPEKTDWSEVQVQQVINRLDAILSQLPEAIKQAHERIIGERQVRSSDKLLSLYDKDVDIIVRGKAGSEVEFGQRLLLTEQKDGLILDWELFSKNAPSDSQIFQPAIKRITACFGKINLTSADRAFWSPSNESFLEEENIFNGICARSPTKMKEQLKDPCFMAAQTRRSQTEGRIGIFKNVFLGTPLRSQILKNKRYAITWCVLTHNLWVLARKTIAEEKAIRKKAA